MNTKKYFKSFLLLIAFLWITTCNAAVIEGNPNGAITLAFVYDYQCPICHQMYPMIEQLTQEFPNLTVRMMPVAAKNKTSLYEAAAAIAATHSNQFDAFNQQVMSAPPMTDTEVAALLNQMGLNTQPFKEAMHSDEIKQQLLQGQALMDASGHSAVPLFVLYPSALDPSHSLVMVGYQSLSNMEAAVREVEKRMSKA